ncbi:MAG: hypothetical protein JNG90_01515 [Planctomycetaceae bacterium]|nr:hypothetical protein [Planctomycetaceae bacterium]
MVGIVGMSQQRKVAASVAEADAHWNAGEQAAAITKYRSVVESEFLSEEHRPRIYGRLIDADLASGGRAAAERLIGLAERKQIVPIVNSPAAKELVAALEANLNEQKRQQAERERENEIKAEQRRRESVSSDGEKLAALEEIVEYLEDFPVSRALLARVVQHSCCTARQLFWKPANGRNFTLDRRRLQAEIKRTARFSRLVRFG